MILVTLVCCYAACWGPTQDAGVTDVRKFVDRGWNASSPLPLVVRIDEYSSGSPPMCFRRYYLWCFGGIVKVPYETQIPVPIFTANDLRKIMKEWDSLWESGEPDQMTFERRTVP